MTTEYFYKTGHCQALSIAEFEAITMSVADHDDDFIYSEKNLKIQRTGGLVFGGVVLYKLPDFDKSKLPDLYEVLFDSISIGRSNDKFKKMGIATPANLSKDLLELCKKAGAKKINILKDQLPNFGHWKQTNDWLVLFFRGKDLMVGEVMDYSDQQFWAKLDTRLPAGDMKRGIINLKLARSLLNLTKKKIVWDPFCGQGRVLVGGLDLKDGFYATDLDAVCVPDVEKNIEHANFQLSKRYNKLAEVKDVFELDARELDDTYIVEQLKRDGTIKDLAIVTEGDLGHNFEKTPNEKEIQRQFKETKKLWQEVLKKADQSGIKEVIFCLPFYNFKRKQILMPFMSELVENTEYKFTNFGDQEYILYSRERSRVGHCIFKVTKY